MRLFACFFVLLAISGCNCGGVTLIGSHVEEDAGSGASDSGGFDSGVADAGSPDAGESDAGAFDAGCKYCDAGSMDAGSMDAGSMDAGSMDAGSMDAGSMDGGLIDGGSIDAGSIDAGAPGVEPLALVWFKSILGVTNVFRPQLRVAADGTAVVGMTFNTYDAGFVLGSGEPGSTTFGGQFMPALAWLDATDGHLLKGTLVAELAFTGVGGTAHGELLTLHEDGATTSGGTMANSLRFFPNTASAQVQVAQTRLLGGNFHVAHDPYFTRFTPARTPAWLARGTTPGPISTTLRNYPLAMTSIPDGGVFVVGEVEAAGFTLSSSSPGVGTYFARFGSNGTLAFLSRNTNSILWRAAATAPDGSIFVVGSLRSPTVTLFSSTADQVTLSRAAGADGGQASNAVLVKVTPAGNLGWAKTIAHDRSTFLEFYKLVATDDGAVVLIGEPGVATLTVYDAAGIAQGTFPQTDNSPGAVGFAADGTVKFVSTLGPAATRLGVFAGTRAPDGGVFMVASVNPGVSQLGIDDGGVRALPSGADAGFSLLYELGADGRKRDIRLLGIGLDVVQLESSPGALTLIGVDYLGNEAVQRVALEDGGLLVLPPCEPTLESSQRMHIVQLRR